MAQFTLSHKNIMDNSNNNNTIFESDYESLYLTKYRAINEYGYFVFRLSVRVEFQT